MEKVIYHYCGFSRNYGDMAIQHSMMDMLSSMSRDRLSFKPIDLKQPKPITIKDVEDMNRTGDMLLVGGGGLIMKGDGFPTESGWQFNISREALEHLRIPLVIYAIGYNQFPYEPELPESTWDHIRATRQKASIFSVREESTVRLLNSKGVDNVRLVPDPAMFTRHSDHAFYELKNIYDIPDDAILIGLNLAGDRGELRHSGKRGNILPIRLHQELVKAQVCSYDDPPCRIVYIPHVDIYDHKDKDILKNLFGPVFCDASVVTRMYPESLPNVTDFVGLYRHMRLTIGMRGHSNILSFGQGVPYIALGDHQKNRSFVAMTDGEYVDDSCNGLAEKVVRLLKNQDRYKLQRRAHELYARINILNADILQLLDTPRCRYPMTTTSTQPSLR